MADFIHINFADFFMLCQLKSPRLEGGIGIGHARGWCRAGGGWEVMVKFQMEAKAEAKTEKRLTGGLS